MDPASKRIRETNPVLVSPFDTPDKAKTFLGSSLARIKFSPQDGLAQEWAQETDHDWDADRGHIDTIRSPGNSDGSHLYLMRENRGLV